MPLTGPSRSVPAGVHDRGVQGCRRVTGAGLAVLGRGPGLPRPDLVPGVGLIVAVDRFMSEARALTNFSGNAVATLVIGYVGQGKSTDAQGRPRLCRARIPSTTSPWSTNTVHPARRPFRLPARGDLRPQEALDARPLEGAPAVARQERKRLGGVDDFGSVDLVGLALGWRCRPFRQSARCAASPPGCRRAAER